MRPIPSWTVNQRGRKKEGQGQNPRREHQHLQSRREVWLVRKCTLWSLAVFPPTQLPRGPDPASVTGPLQPPLCSRLGAAGPGPAVLDGRPVKPPCRGRVWETDMVPHGGAGGLGLLWASESFSVRRDDDGRIRCDHFVVGARRTSAASNSDCTCLGS